MHVIAQFHGLEIGEWPIDDIRQRTVGTERHLAVDRVVEFYFCELEYAQCRHTHFPLVVHRMKQRLEKLHYSHFCHIGRHLEFVGHFASHLFHGVEQPFLLFTEQWIRHKMHGKVRWHESPFPCDGIDNDILIALLHQEFPEITNHELCIGDGIVGYPFHNGRDILFSHFG